MSIASKADRIGMDRVGTIVQMTLDALAAAVRPGITTADLDGVARHVVQRYGARSAPAVLYGFPATVLVSVNDEITIQARDGWTIRTRNGSLASHHEHTLMITRGLPVILTAAA